jgi:membrane-associated phospholipid phosphatase
MWPIILTTCALAAIPFWLTGFSFEEHFLTIFFKGPAIGFVAARLLMRYPIAYAFGGAVEGIFLMSFAALIGLLACYAAAAGGAPLVDAQLVRIDRWLGYDWVAYAKFCAAHPWLLQSMRLAYSTNLTQPAVIGAILYMSSRAARFEKFVLANIICVLVTALVFLLFPATTAWSFQGQEALATRILPDLPISTNSWLGDLMQIRAGSGRHLTRLAGIVAFPSFHCASAILNAWAVWPVRRLRLAFMALNLLMIAATPVIGGHYLADLIGGALVAVLTIVVVGGFHRRFLNSNLLRLPPSLSEWLEPRPFRDPNKAFAD